MKKLKKLLKILTVEILITQISYSFSFFKTSETNTDGCPNWVRNGVVKEKEFNYYGIGSAKKHINGNAEQKKLALARAIDELAFQKSVKINTELNLYQKNENSNMYQVSEYKTNENINFKIVDTWIDSNTGELFYLIGGN